MQNWHFLWFSWIHTSKISLKILRNHYNTNLSEGNGHIQENRNPELQTHLDPCQEGVNSTKEVFSVVINHSTNLRKPLGQFYWLAIISNMKNHIKQILSLSNRKMEQRTTKLSVVNQKLRRTIVWWNTLDPKGSRLSRLRTTAL